MTPHAPCAPPFMIGLFLGITKYEISYGAGRQQDQAECLHVAHLQQGCSHFLPQMPDPVLVPPVAGSPSLLVSAGPCSATALMWDQTVLAHPCKSKGGFADVRLEGGWCPTLERLLQTWGEADLKRDASSLGQAPPQPGVAEMYWKATNGFLGFAYLVAQPHWGGTVGAPSAGTRDTVPWGFHESPSSL